MKRLIVLLLCWHTAFASIFLEIDPPTIRFDQTTRLTLTIDTIHNRGVPDLTPLLSDFDIISTERSLNYSMMNGQARSISQWGIVLKPKKIGVISIPPIHIGHDQTLSSQVTVKASAPTPLTLNKGNHESGNSIFTTAIDNPSPFINQQIIYTVQLFNRQRLLDAQYQPPQVEDALLIPLGEGRHYQTQTQGQIYDVDEQKYAIFPQKTGTLLIRPPSFHALADQDGSPIRIDLQGRPITLQVKPAPQDQKTWLPARQVELTESYDWSGSTADEGTTIVRTINVKAEGVVAQMLPVLSFTSNEEYRVYPEKPSTDNSIQNNTLWGTSQIQVTYLLSKPGHITLPAIEVPWYNVVTKQTKIAKLPSRIFTVKPKAGMMAAKKKSRPHALKHLKVSQPSNKIKPNWLWIGIGISVIIFLMMGFIYWYICASRKQSPLEVDKPQDTFHNACKSNDPKRVRAALLAFARVNWPKTNILNLHDIPIIDPAFKLLIDQLSAALYSPGHQDWRAEELWRYISKLRTNDKKPQKRKRQLPPIHPQRDKT